MTKTRHLAAWGLLGCAMMAMTPLGCANSVESAPIRYRAQSRGPYLPDATVEGLQGCVDNHADELMEGPHHVKAHMQVDSEGRKLDFKVTGIPENAPNLAACTRIALQGMTVPMQDLPLRPDETATATNEQTVPRGNEVANPIVVWEIGTALAEFVAAHGGRVILYTVTIEVVGSAGMVGTMWYLKRRQKKKTCQEHLSDCLMTPTNDKQGNNWNTRRCLTCFDRCEDGNWPASVYINKVESCAY